MNFIVEKCELLIQALGRWIDSHKHPEVINFTRGRRLKRAMAVQKQLSEQLTQPWVRGIAMTKQVSGKCRIVIYVDHINYEVISTIPMWIRGVPIDIEDIKPDSPKISGIVQDHVV